jgi:hypothetical protein
MTLSVEASITTSPALVVAYRREASGDTASSRAPTSLIESTTALLPVSITEMAVDSAT